ncbi:hypothetical protein Hanom_Chr07g00614711 [Helianthus anomalus]
MVSSHTTTSRYHGINRLLIAQTHPFRGYESRNHPYVESVSFKSDVSSCLKQLHWFGPHIINFCSNFAIPPLKKKLVSL